MFQSYIVASKFTFGTIQSRRRVNSAAQLYPLYEATLPRAIGIWKNDQKHEQKAK